ncbi:hypothetical protein STEG23_033757, partial [Scotinomys teguina]
MEVDTEICSLEPDQVPRVWLMRETGESVALVIVSFHSIRTVEKTEIDTMIVGFCCRIPYYAVWGRVVEEFWNFGLKQPLVLKA